jgi:hypothetical protein
MHQMRPDSAFKQAVEQGDRLAIDHDILAWFKARGRGWQGEIRDVLAFYIHTAEHPASEPEPPASSGPTLKPDGCG